MALATNVGVGTTTTNATVAGEVVAPPATVTAGVTATRLIADGNAVASPPAGGNTTMRVRADIAATASTPYRGG